MWQKPVEAAGGACLCCFVGGSESTSIESASPSTSSIFRLAFLPRPLPCGGDLLVAAEMENGERGGIGCCARREEWRDFGHGRGLP
ncbi:hypothetical protein FH972_024299 [Carpinus fangiana]|uniref:Uncharacterized protein n=1 Tax=Carpinus fangiana TaxID=176857 RepID=A0A5N6KXN4_9ROSI|nr:hypothetical protein FH972_024299 [Carpinus fangiana]